MTSIIRAILIVILSTSMMSCGKRGDLLPPEGYEPPKAAHGTDVGHATPKAHKAASHGNDKKAMPKVHKGGFANKNCASDGQGKNCKVIAKAH